MDVVIVGAGISGLAAAISLRRCGHRVTIYERTGLNKETGAAISLPPNVTRFLLPWGLDTSRFVTSSGMQIQSFETLQVWQSHDHTKTKDVFGAPLMYAHRVDLHQSLKQLATDPDGLGSAVKIYANSRVVKFNTGDTSITLTDGTIVAGDLVIAADGIHSKSLESILGHDNPPRPAKGHNCCYRFLIPTAELKDDPETKFFVESPDLQLCRLYGDPATKRRLLVYPCRNFKMLNFGGICYKEDLDEQLEDFQLEVDKSDLLETYAGYHPGLLAVINKATDVKRWPLLYRPPVSTWHKGRVVAVGDAAHPMLLHHGQGGAQGLEDGLAIGLVMQGVTDVSQIEQRLALFEQIRRNRASSIQILSNTPYEDPVPSELAEYLEGEPLPTSVFDTVRLAYGPNLVQRVVSTMTDANSDWKLPEGFFPGEFAAKPAVVGQ